METNFFQQVAGLQITGNLRLNIQPQDDGTMTVSLLLVNESLKDKAAGKIPPLILKGSTDELDGKFFETISAPIQKTNQLLCNMKEHEQALKSVQTQTSSKTTGSAGNKDKDIKRRRFDEQMKKVTDLERLGRIGEAIGQLPDCKTYPEYAEEIKTKMQQLRSKHGALSLFGEADDGQAPMTDSTNEEPADAACDGENNLDNGDDDNDLDNDAGSDLDDDDDIDDLDRLGDENDPNR